MMVAYINRPPKMDMAAAPPAISAECHSSVGRAGDMLDGVSTLCRLSVLTNTHDDKEARQEPSKVDDAVAGALHKVIAVRCSSTEPVGQGRDHVGCDNEKREVVLEERGGENDEEKADGQDLVARPLAQSQCEDEARVCDRLTYKGQAYDGLDTGHGGVVRQKGRVCIVHGGCADVSLVGSSVRRRCEVAVMVRLAPRRLMVRLRRTR